MSTGRTSPGCAAPHCAPTGPGPKPAGVVVSMAAWVDNQEREVARRRTEEGLAAARALGKTLGIRRYLTGDLAQPAMRMQEHREVRTVSGPGPMAYPSSSSGSTSHWAPHGHRYTDSSTLLHQRPVPSEGQTKLIPR